MKCPRCGGFTQYFKSYWLSCRRCDWKEERDMSEKQFADEMKRIMDMVDFVNDSSKQTIRDDK